MVIEEGHGNLLAADVDGAKFNSARCSYSTGESPGRSDTSSTSRPRAIGAVAPTSMTFVADSMLSSRLLRGTR